MLTISFSCTAAEAAFLSALYDILENSRAGASLDNCSQYTFRTFDNLVDILADESPKLVRIMIEDGFISSINELSESTRALYNSRMKIDT